jgi:hypothetical protein
MNVLIAKEVIVPSMAVLGNFVNRESDFGYEIVVGDFLVYENMGGKFIDILYQGRY